MVLFCTSKHVALKPVKVSVWGLKFQSRISSEGTTDQSDGRICLLYYSQVFDPDRSLLHLKANTETDNSSQSYMIQHVFVFPDQVYS